MKLTVKGSGNKLMYVDEAEREKAREFRHCLNRYEEWIRLYVIQYEGTDYLFMDGFTINKQKLEDDFFIKAYRKNNDIDINLYTEKLLKKTGLYQLYKFLEKQHDLYQKNKVKCEYCSDHADMVYKISENKRMLICHNCMDYMKNDKGFSERVHEKILGSRSN